MRHTIALWVYDEPGVLTRVAGLFSRRGYNIDTITVGKTNAKGISKMVITVLGDNRVIEQVEKQLNKLIDVIRIIELHPDDAVILELCLVKVNATNKKAKDDIIKYADVYKNKIVDITQNAITVRVIGESQKVDTFLELVAPFGIKDISRTGVTGIHRDGQKHKQDKDIDRSIGV